VAENSGLSNGEFTVYRRYQKSELQQTDLGVRGSFTGLVHRPGWFLSLVKWFMCCETGNIRAVLILFSR
jgi:hypothetical protein